jgi:hypothetical protein
VPRRPRTNDDEISLFPFLSIIACVIGVLTMMIATLALAQTDTPDVAQIERYEEDKKSLDRTQSRIEEIKLEISDSLKIREQQKQNTANKTELTKMLAELEAIEKELAEQKKIQIVIPKVDPQARETANDMQAQHQQLEEQIAQLEQDLKERKDKSEANVTVLPQGSGLNFKPHFVECAADSFVMHTQTPPKRIRTANAAKAKEFIDLMEVAANGKADSIVFLVRSDGLATFRNLKSMCVQRSIRNGKLPVVGQGRIDLSAFTNKKK